MGRSGETTGRETRRRLSSILDRDDLDHSLQEIRALPRGRALRALFAFLSESDEERKARAVFFIGSLTADLAGESMEEARELMRRLTWSLNEESGSSGWGAPEAMAEIMAAHEGLAAEYAHLLVSYMHEDGNYLENPLLQRGLLRGIGRLAETRPALTKDLHADLHLLPFLESGDSVVRGLAAWCAGLLGACEARPGLESLGDEATEIDLYEDGRVVRRRTGHLAREALDRLDRMSG